MEPWVSALEPAKKFGALFSGSFDYNGRGIDDIEPSLNDTAVPSYSSMDLREYRYRRKRYGFGGGLDYKLGDGAGLYLHYFYSDFRDFGDKWVYTLNDGTGCDGTATNGCPPEKFSGSERAPDYRIGNLAIGGKHIFTNSWLAWNVSASASLQTAAAGNPGFDFTYNPNAPTTVNGQVPVRHSARILLRPRIPTSRSGPQAATRREAPITLRETGACWMSIPRLGTPHRSTCRAQYRTQPTII